MAPPSCRLIPGRARGKVRAHDGEPDARCPVQPARCLFADPRSHRRRPLQARRPAGGIGTGRTFRRVAHPGARGAATAGNPVDADPRRPQPDRRLARPQPAGRALRSAGGTGGACRPPCRAPRDRGRGARAAGDGRGRSPPAWRPAGDEPGQPAVPQADPSGIAQPLSGPATRPCAPIDGAAGLDLAGG